MSDLVRLARKQTITLCVFRSEDTPGKFAVQSEEIGIFLSFSDCLSPTWTLKWKCLVYFPWLQVTNYIHLVLRPWWILCIVCPIILSGWRTSVLGVGNVLYTVLRSVELVSNRFGPTVHWEKEPYNSWSIHHIQCFLASTGDSSLAHQQAVWPNIHSSSWKCPSATSTWLSGRASSTGIPTPGAPSSQNPYMLPMRHHFPNWRRVTDASAQPSHSHRLPVWSV